MTLDPRGVVCEHLSEAPVSGQGAVHQGAGASSTMLTSCSAVQWSKAQLETRPTRKGPGLRDPRPLHRAAFWVPLWDELPAEWDVAGKYYI